ncbi:MAG: lipocalin-like domain-containing protein [Pseudomonas sp.]|uniref:lipocalin-like domain-containing protein n=1 Tax=Pseudomonas abieticivorans TaxID=2931382 RepID=UPI0020C172AA|nr:lipocalin-like domain-containing protein [Pseudomonas sp. PIA16]MDE1164056.1 lipocalin-like domain-containing protein [Pseudomonas sp.]
MNANTWVIIALALLAGCDANDAPAPGYAGLNQNAQGFAQVTPGRTFVFPQDHGAHPDYRIEWWYVTANLKADDGQAFGVQWTLFRNALAPGAEASGWSHRSLWLGHAALTTASQHFVAQALARGGIGQAGVNPSPFKAWIDDWQMQSLASPGQDPAGNLLLSARGDDFSYRLHLSTAQAPVLQGQQGYSQKSDQGQASYYYSQPFYQASGEVSSGGKTWHVTGHAWLDREWSSQPLAAQQTGWDWFSLHLADGQQVMLYRLRYANGTQHLSGNWISADGRNQSLGSEAITLTPTASHRVQGRSVPVRWQVQVPSKGLDVTLQALNPNAWMNVSPPYWEGPVQLNGSTRGEGYLEMTGY